MIISMKRRLHAKPFRLSKTTVDWLRYVEHKSKSHSQFNHIHCYAFETCMYVRALKHMHTNLFVCVKNNREFIWKRYRHSLIRNSIMSHSTLLYRIHLFCSNTFSEQAMPKHTFVYTKWKRRNEKKIRNTTLDVTFAIELEGIETHEVMKSFRW